MKRAIRMNTKRHKPSKSPKKKADKVGGKEIIEGSGGGGDRSNFN